MKFAHLADVHLGNWRDETMKGFVEKAFVKAIDKCIEEKVDFTLIAGDLFNTAMPSVSHLKLVISKLRELKENSIPVYYIAGSHDFSASGKTMLDVIEEADLGINVTKGDVTDEGKLSLKFTEDKKTRVNITGLIGRKGTLEKRYYEALDSTSLSSKEGFKIFMFHTAIDELKPSHLNKMEGSPISFLPKGFDYYAGGHIHIVKNESIKGYQNVVYPGPVFPANAGELEKLGEGSFFIYDFGEVRKVPLKVVDFELIDLKANDMDSFELKDKLWNYSMPDCKDKLILIKITGKLSSGKVLDLDLKNYIQELYDKGAKHVLKSTSGLKTPEYENASAESKKVDEIEHDLIEQSLAKFKHVFKDEKAAFVNFMSALNVSKLEGETNSDFEDRLLADVQAVLSENLK